MFPSIRDGDILHVEPVDPKQIKQGDVIFYRTPDKRMAAHRVVKKSSFQGRPLILARGDFNAGSWDEVSLENILGRVKTIERDSKTLYLGRSRNGFMDRLYASHSPFMKINKKIAARLIRRIQGARAYRKLAKGLVKETILYEWELLQDSARRLFAINKNSVIGSVTISNSSNADYLYQGWWISNMWVDWRYRGLGIGGHLTERLCDFAARSGASCVNLLVFKDNQAAIRLYQNSGFSLASITGIDKQLKEEAEEFGRQQIIMRRGFGDNKKALIPDYDNR